MMPHGSPTIVLVSSSKDPASQNLARELVENQGFASTRIAFRGRALHQKDSLLLATIDEEIIRPPNLDDYFNPQAYIFLSKHRAKSGVPSLTAHTTGNFGEAELGGNPREIARVNPDLLKNYLISLTKQGEAVSGYQVTAEATHHGPTSLNKPVLFVEIGSDEKNWNDRDAAKAVAIALLQSLREARSWDKVAVGFGGTHYPEKFNKLLLEDEFAFAAIVPKYALREVDSALFGQILQKSTKLPRYALLDWKGLGPEKDKIVGLVRQYGLEAVRV
ncbi:MAG: D-tyrosyl-tRNA(Tyr) deacylase [Thaumarchaeota archaeon]|nr:MAG: D-tyrosyl-tRNA(Tyr) deacylase [Nitrososphaerota archaeon]